MIFILTMGLMSNFVYESCQGKMTSRETVCHVIILHKSQAEKKTKVTAMETHGNRDLFCLLVFVLFFLNK